MNAHTLGPWELLPSLQIAAGSKIIAETVTCGSRQDAANAHLIAAAPELLEACKAAYHLSADWPTQRVFAEIAEQLAKAIAKAEGNQ